MQVLRFCRDEPFITYIGVNNGSAGSVALWDRVHKRVIVILAPTTATDEHDTTIYQTHDWTVWLTLALALSARNPLHPLHPLHPLQGGIGLRYCSVYKSPSFPVLHSHLRSPQLSQRGCPSSSVLFGHSLQSQEQFRHIGPRPHQRHETSRLHRLKHFQHLAVMTLSHA